jgi:hypothetical protein
VSRLSPYRDRDGLPKARGLYSRFEKVNFAHVIRRLITGPSTECARRAPRSPRHDLSARRCGWRGDAPARPDFSADQGPRPRRSDRSRRRNWCRSVAGATEGSHHRCSEGARSCLRLAESRSGIATRSGSSRWLCRARPTRRYGGLEIVLADRFDQIHFKLYASVDQGPLSKHFADLKALEPTRDELLAAARWARTHDPSAEFARELAKALEALAIGDADELI